MKMFLVAAALIAMPAFGQMAMPSKPQCIRAETVSGFEQWGRGGTGGTIGIGSMATLELAPVASARIDPAPARPLAAGTFASQFPLQVMRAGTYRIALSGGAWIEVVRDGKPIESVAHGPGAACSGIRKIVDFPLVPGSYVVQLSESATPSLAVLIVPKS